MPPCEAPFNDAFQQVAQESVVTVATVEDSIVEEAPQTTYSLDQVREILDLERQRLVAQTNMMK